MTTKWKSKAFSALVMAVCVRGCVPAVDDASLQQSMQWNASKQAELGISDSTSNNTAVTDRRSIVGGFFTEGLGGFRF